MCSTYHLFDEGYEAISLGLLRLRVSHHPAVTVERRGRISVSHTVGVCLGEGHRREHVLASRSEQIPKRGSKLSPRCRYDTRRAFQCLYDVDHDICAASYARLSRRQCRVGVRRPCAGAKPIGRRPRSADGAGTTSCILAATERQPMANGRPQQPQPPPLLSNK